MGPVHQQVPDHPWDLLDPRHRAAQGYQLDPEGGKNDIIIFVGVSDDLTVPYGWTKCTLIGVMTSVTTSLSG